jgi:TonB family protein
MMSTSANILTTPQLFDLHVRKFRSICDRHGVPFGSHKYLHGFIHTLAENKHFATEFWAFTGKLSSRDEGQLSDEHMLAVIVEGIAGDDVPDAPDAVDELKSVANQLASLLAGANVQSPLRKSVEPIPFPRPELDSQPAASGVTARDAGELPVRASASRVVFISEAPNRELGRPASSLPSRPPAHPRAVFISEAIDREAGAARSSPPPLSSSHPRAAFVSEWADAEAAPASSSPLRPSSSHPRATFLSELAGGEAAPVSSLPFRLSSSHSRASFIPEVVDGEAAPAFSLPSTLPSAPPAAFVPEVVDDEVAPPSSLPLPSTLPTPPPAAPDAEAVVGETAPPAQHTMSIELQEALQRLQLSNLELKQQLDEINEKMSRLEAHPEDLTAKEAASKATTPERVEKTAAPRVEQSTFEHAHNSRPLAQPEAVPASELLASAYLSKWSEPPTPVVLKPYADRTRPRDILRYAAILLVLVGGAFLMQQYGTPLQNWSSPLRHRLQAAIANQLEVNVAKETRATEPAPAPAPAGAGVLGFFRDPPASRDTPPPPPAPSEQAAPTIPRESQPGSQGSISSRAESPLATALRSVFSGDNSGPVSVDAAVMQNNLIRSRAPAYPAAAGADHVAGPVVVKAIISKSGAVQDVDVIDGDPLLRRAAAEAISKWRYRPYLVNGQPVKAATTITVDVAPNR